MRYLTCRILTFLPVPVNLRIKIHRLQASQIGSALVNYHPVRNPVGGDSTSEEAECRCQITALRQHKIKGFAIAINGTVEIGSSAFDLDVGLVHSPGRNRPVVLAVTHRCGAAN